MKSPTDRRRFLQGTAGLGALSMLATPNPATASAGPKRSGIVLWLAHSMFHPGSLGKPADEDFIKAVVGRCQDKGFDTLYIQPRYVGKAVYHSKVVSLFDSMYTADGGILVKALEQYDPYDVAVREAKRRGLRVIAQTSPFDHWFPGLEDRFYEQHPENLMVDRRSQRLYYQGVPCYAEPGAQEYCLAEIGELLERGAEGISLAMDSHQINWWPPGYGEREGDSFGFNPPLVKEFERRYGVNVLKQDYDKSKWYALHGEFFTAFLRRVKAVLKDKPLIVGIPPEGHLAYSGHPYWTGTLGAFSQSPGVRIDLEWQKWLQEGIVDELHLYISGLQGPFGPYVMNVAEAMKQAGKKGIFCLNISSSDADELRNLVGQVRASALDGWVFHEEAYFESNPALWKAFA